MYVCLRVRVCACVCSKKMLGVTSAYTPRCEIKDPHNALARGRIESQI